MLAIFCSLLVTHLYPATAIPSTYAAKPAVKHITITNHANALPIVATIEISKTNAREKKAPNIPLSLPVSHHILVPNLHVIPIQHHIHASHIIGDNKVTIINHNGHGTNNTHTLIPVLIPIHNLVPVHDLTVIPLHRVDTKISFNNNDDRDRYRNPLGGYGAGWAYGGHGAGHGFHYAYG